jgi:hypothetical protein
MVNLTNNEIDNVMERPIKSSSLDMVKKTTQSHWAMSQIIKQFFLWSSLLGPFYHISIKL